MTGEERAIRTQWSEAHDAGVAAACPSFEALSAYFDGELPDAEMRSIRLHVASCPRCAPVIADFRSISSLLNDAEALTLPRSFALTESMVDREGASAHPIAPVTPITRATRGVNRLHVLPIITAIAALLLIAFIGGEVWTGGDSSSSPDSANRVVMIGGVPVEVDDDATFGAASAGAMNGSAPTTEAGQPSAAPAAGSSGSWDWFNWWRPFEAVLGLTIVALIVTMLSRRRPRRAQQAETSPIQ